MKNVLLSGAMILAGLGSVANAAEWEELGEGSATPPGLFRLEDFKPGVSPLNRCSLRPEIGMTRQGKATLTYYSTAGTGSYSGLFSVSWQGDAWSNSAGTDEGEIMAESGFSLARKGSFARPYSLSTLTPVSQTSAEAPSMLIGFPALMPFEFAANAYAGLYHNSSGWTGRGNSLADGGLTAPAGFNDQTFEVATALDSFGNPYVAYSKGADAKRGIFVQRFRFGVWSGLDDSATTPVAAPGTYVNNYHPAISFTGGSPVVAWTEKNSTIETVKLLRYDSSSEQWVGIGSSATTGIGYGRNPQLANFQGRTSLFIAYENTLEKSLEVKEWNGLELLDRGDPLAPWGLEKLATFADSGTSNPEPPLPSFALALDLLGRPAVVFRAESPAGSGQYHLFASYFNPSTRQWSALGNDQDETGVTGLPYVPVSNPPTGRGYGHYNPSLVFGVDNHPVVAWELDLGTSDCPIIMVRRLDTPAAIVPPSPEQAVNRILTLIPPNPTLDDSLDVNNDNVLDAADVIRLRVN